jgi:hypothetical protein
MTNSYPTKGARRQITVSRLVKVIPRYGTPIEGFSAEVDEGIAA